MSELQALRIAGLAVLVAVIALGAAAFIHEACFEALPFEPPGVGTPRAGYCDAINPSHPWFSLTVVPVLAMLIGGFLLRRLPRAAFVLSAVLCAIVVANAVVVNGLEYAPAYP